MLAVMLLSQHQVSSSKTVRPCVPCGARCMGHDVRTWSAVCSAAPLLQFGEEARLHLCMDEWNRPTTVCRQVNLSQTVWDKLTPIGMAPVLSIKTRSLDVFSQQSAFHLRFVHLTFFLPMFFKWNVLFKLLLKSQFYS